MSTGASPAYHPANCSIQPTSAVKTEEGQVLYTDIAMTGLFNAHVAILGQEVRGIWQRYNILLITNGLIFSFLGSAGRGRAETILGSVLGLILCYAWWVLLRTGWDYFHKWYEATMRFSWPQLGSDANPLVYVALKGLSPLPLLSEGGEKSEVKGFFAGLRESFIPRRDSTYWVAQVIILAFVFGYVALLVYNIFR